MMPDNAALLDRLFTALDKHDHITMASCYREHAHFRDIAFDLVGRTRIHSMWHMICSGDIRADYEILEADDCTGLVRLVDTYRFGASKIPHRKGRHVRNEIESRFTFKDGLIVRHEDHCDPKAWARAALGGIIGFAAGRVRMLRSYRANAMLADFVEAHPQYRKHSH
jgi:ketosteroid isomerase-like protein